MSVTAAPAVEVRPQAQSAKLPGRSVHDVHNLQSHWAEISDAGKSALAGLRVGVPLAQDEYVRVLSYVRQLEQDIVGHVHGQEQLQAEVNVACVGQSAP